MARLGFGPEQYNAPNFDFLSELEFTKQQVEEASNIICGTMTIEGAPHLKTEHLPVFDCANKCGEYGQRYIEPMAHVRMVAATQPFLSGSISKTINMPHETTVEEVENLYVEAWKLGIEGSRTLSRRIETVPTSQLNESRSRGGGTGSATNPPSFAQRTLFNYP